ncbi:helix-hairpin-helix domain-containing protein [Aurantiacibacter aquimixticola]|uniref:Helix-hairpin-helix DNA-binding motif class 1 domain-containing protein n=1 Tax=Aurantiacibacter aquimixticola TaxID=1958945 RepID=A0A419RTE4_9SPHN|nr:helix-hairpin-helix domain-containing protein [Aurantiacibacter aquimixticola]RJY09062.1 hypothetical protein D6201_06535 [Aurantiacibacter aquimixticola]
MRARPTYDNRWLWPLGAVVAGALSWAASKVVKSYRDKGQADDLTRIKGIGPKLAAKLMKNGIARFEQIASWTKSDIEEMDRKLDLAGRIERDDWVKQARKLAREG